MPGEENVDVPLDASAFIKGVFWGSADVIVERVYEEWWREV